MKQSLRVIAFLIFSCTFVHAQTIADLARKERTKQQAAPKTVVINNQVLKSEPSATPEQKPAAQPAPTPASAAAEDPAKPGGHDEKWWRGQFAIVREEIQRLETQLPLLENDVKTANREFLTRAYDPDGRGKKAIDESNNALETAKTAIAKGYERVAKLEEDLRRAGGPAGWAR